MPTRVYMDGAIRDEATAVVPVFDRGFLYGDSVYEVTRTSAGRPVDLERHLQRLERSAAGIMLPMFPRATVESAIERTLAAAANPDSYIRTIVTRGVGEVGLDPALADHPRLIVIVRPLTRPPEELYRDGAAIAIVGVRRTSARSVDPAVKSGNYLNNILALAEAKRAGAYEALMCNAEGRLAEGSTSNIFLVDRTGCILTPSLDDGLLDGVTRRRVIELARAESIPIEEAHLSPDDLLRAAEAFITSSIRGVMPVVRVDGAPLGAGTPGATTRRVMALYERFLARVATGAL